MVGPGCVSLSTYNSPQTMPKDEFHLGIGGGGTLINETVAGPVPEVYGRVGVGERMDIGGKFTGPIGGITADLKYQLLEGGIDVAAGLGGSIFFTGPNVIYPALFFGTERLYGGARVVVFASHPNYDDDVLAFRDAFPEDVMPGIIVGGSFGGEEFRLMPELGVYFPDGSEAPLLTPGVGLQFRLGGGG